MYVKRRGWWLVLVLLLVACQPAALPPAPPQPTPEVLTLAYPSALRWLEPAFNACALEEPALSVLVVSASESPDVTLYWGESGVLESEAVELGQDALVLVAHPDNPLNGLSLTEAQQLFTAQADTWPNGEKLTVYVLPPGHAVQTAFETALGRPIPRSVVIQIAPSLEAMRQYVADDPTALGVLPRSWLDKEVKALSGEMEATQPILATFKATRAETFVRCLQRAIVEKLNQ